MSEAWDECISLFTLMKINGKKSLKMQTNFFHDVNQYLKYENPKKLHMQYKTLIYYIFAACNIYA